MLFQFLDSLVNGTLPSLDFVGYMLGGDFLISLFLKLNERNVTARLSVVVPRKEADAALDKLEAAFVSGFALKEATP